MEEILEKEEENELETELTPENCMGYHLYPYQRRMAQVHICNKCYNPERGYDMKWFWKECGLEREKLSK